MAKNESAWQKLIPISRIELVAGLSCCADEDLHHLSRWAAEGWQVVEVRRLCVVLERTSPARVEFALDYQHYPDGEYFELCRVAGWTHVVSLSHSIHLFRAPIGNRMFFGTNDTTMVLRAQQRLHRAVLLRGLALIIVVWLVTALVWPWIASYADGVLAWVLVGSAFVSMYALMVMVWYTALPWVVYQMRRYGVNIRWSRQRARMCVDGLSVVAGALCGWLVAY
jgi:hypothetical protein